MRYFLISLRIWAYIALQKQTNLAKIEMMSSLRLLLPGFVAFLLLAATCVQAQDNTEEEKRVIIRTDYGDMIVKLYNDTPQHRDNFLKLASEGFYDGLLFHRVISGFMIQGGDPDSKNAPDGAALGTGGMDYRIPAEIVPGRYHKKGALAAARQSDQVNPAKESSGCQFYIVQGRETPENILRNMETRQSKQSGKTFKYSDEAVLDYTTIGGAPHLDGEYTVFGEVLYGIEVIDQIAAVEVDGRARPTKNITMRIEIIE